MQKVPWLLEQSPLGDLPWAARRILRKIVVTGLPIRLHLEIAFMRGWIHGLISKAPPHVVQNIEVALNGSGDFVDLNATIGRYLQFSKRRYLVRMLPRLPGFNNPRRWVVEGLEHLENALTRNRGVILVSAHLGYVRLITPILRTHGYDVKQVASGARKRLKQRRAEEEWVASGTRFRRYVYERTHVLAHPLDSFEIVAGLDVRPIFDALSHNQPVMILGDGMRAADFVKLSLLGRPYPFPAGFMKLAMMTEAPLLPVFAVEGDRSRLISIEIGPPLLIDRAASVADNVEVFALVLDKQLRKTPHLWLRWGHKDLFQKVVEWCESDRRYRYDSQW